MPDISQFNFGYDADGVNVYLENIRSIVLTEAAAALDDTSAIEKVCKEVHRKIGEIRRTVVWCRRGRKQKRRRRQMEEMTNE